MKNEFKIEYLDPRTLVPYEENAKIHDEQQIADLVKAIQKRGFDQPITVDAKMVIITGHGRREAAIQAGMKTVPVIVRRDLSEEETRAKRLEDNRLASTDYDSLKLQRELKELIDVEIDVFGFSDRELSVLVEDMTRDMDVDSLVSDLATESERQREEHEEISSTVAAGTARITDVLGFKEIPMSEAITVGDLMAYMEDQTGEFGVSAFIAFARQISAEMNADE
ncbi:MULTISPECIES: ParB/Srx family N-terminal domain-containing protein [Klebsiella]|jgi:ParB/RepB/Spo0J family partition protein|uniref:ParB/Srx family N-terminal domain-containing protein n=1 Tax=Klebsiella TaxID=570 RepID=UPI000667E518|nr:MULTISPECIES: ParB/Srx family N-terminal domain-containing protein [Klebsiella]QBL52323.1 chromosome partitioning protein ParB [Klebsiella sp. PO552]QLT68233.1 ParB N-terminal domain-containing protein [Klebsiella oxytoca]DAL48416.1 MAG TPA_asm: ParB protein [Caudoviricetes sp.]HCI6031484.1 ParB N-terminal domain-containing protein [Klebsiella quasipneumoniae subsp. quasipneumoniae]HDU3818629.1 ParB N-terminal domain-containing protein [Klebsiella pneumoniae subsp. pneumoniae]